MCIQTANLILNILLSVGVFFLIFIKSYFTEKGKNVATVEDIGKITLEVENVKDVFSSKMEGLKSDLAKGNIAYGIYNKEYVKLRFERIDDLYFKLYEFQKWIKTYLFSYADETDFKNKVNEFHKQYQIVEVSFYKAILYITEEETKLKIIKLLNQSWISLNQFSRLYVNDPNINNYALDPEIRTRLFKESQDSFQKIFESANEYKSLLDEIEVEFKRNLSPPK
jgi:hypothetical protein